jgi:pyruvate,orthophosphate dikinase
VASGTVVTDSDEAVEGTVLARPTTSPEDVGGMIAARAVVTEHGGATSHAAVVTRALGRPSVVGVGEGVTAEWAGREVTVDGSAGVVYAGTLPTHDIRSNQVPGLDTLIDWARELSPVVVVDSASDVLDLDEAGFTLDPENEPDIDALAAHMAGAHAVTGSILSTAAGARAVLRSGVPVVVRLPGQHAAVLLLRLVQEAKEEKAS